jgi:hypothetical protein
MFIQRLVILTLSFTLASVGPVQAQSFDSVMHIHSIKAFGDKALLGTHNGLFEFQAQNSMKPIGAERFDVMGLAISGKTIFASGHPGPGSKLPEPVGLLRSDDAGKSWKKISLQGTVDFHFLQAGKSELYGTDAQTGNLMYSSNLGKSWKVLGTNLFSDIAISNLKPGHAFALDKTGLIKTSNSFSTQSRVKTEFEINSVEFIGNSLYAASGKDIYLSKNEGKNWKKVATFKSEVADISVSEKIIVAIVGKEVLISKDNGRSFNR